MYMSGKIFQKWNTKFFSNNPWNIRRFSVIVENQSLGDCKVVVYTGRTFVTPVRLHGCSMWYLQSHTWNQFKKLEKELTDNHAAIN